MQKRKIKVGWFICILGLCMSLFPVSTLRAEDALVVALLLERNELKEGETMQVSVSLLNYKKGDAEKQITTMITNVSFDAEKIEVNAGSIMRSFDKGDGFCATQLVDTNNLEQQYLNILAPLPFGTTELFTFEIKAKETITKLADTMSVTFVIAQDGRSKVSKVFSVIPSVLVDGKPVEAETPAEKITSEYGTIPVNKEDVSKVEEIIASQGEKKQEETTASNNPGNNDMTSDKEDEITKQTTGSVTEEAAETVDGAEDIDKKETEKNETQRNESGESQQDKEKSDKDRTDKAEAEQAGGKMSITIVICLGILVIAVVALSLFKKRNLKKKDGKVDF